MDEDSIDTKINKLKRVLPYLLHHSRGHAEDVEKWRTTAEAAQRSDIAAELEKITGLFGQIHRHFESAIGKLEQQEGAADSDRLKGTGK